MQNRLILIHTLITINSLKFTSKMKKKIFAFHSGRGRRHQSVMYVTTDFYSSLKSISFGLDRCGFD